MEAMNNRLASIEAEQAVLGAVFLDPEALRVAQEQKLTAESFSQIGHRKLWAAMVEQADNGRPVDLITLSEVLQQREELQSVGGPEYLVELSSNTPSSANVATYAEIVVGKAMCRRWVHVLEQAREAFFDPVVADPLSEAERILGKLDSRAGVEGLVRIRDVFRPYIQELEARVKRDGPIGLPTGYRHMDYHLNGFQDGRLYVIAGRPGMGKTALALNILRNVAISLHAKQEPYSLLLFSLEMGRIELMDRFIAAEGRIEHGLLQSGKASKMEGQWPKVGAAASALKDVNIQMCDASSMTDADIVSMARHAHRHEPVRMIVVDYLGLVDSAAQADRHDLRIANISGAMKKLSRELKCSVLLLSQLSREVEKRRDKRPLLSDLKDSGAIESDADAVLFCYRDEYYNENTDYPGQIEVIYGKNRGGKTGSDYFVWNGGYQLIEDIPDEQHPPSSSGYEYQ